MADLGFTLIGSAAGETSSSVSSIACSGALNVAAGDLIVAVSKWEGADPTTTIAGATNTLTMLTAVQRGSALGLRIGYKIAASADAAETFTASFAASRGYVSIAVVQFRPDAGDEVTLDASGAGANGSSTNAQSANFATSADVIDSLLIGAAGVYIVAAMSGYQIADTNADGSEDGPTASYGAIWYRTVIAQQTNIHAQCTNSDNQWVADACAFQAVAGEPPPGGGVVTIAASMNRRRRG